MENCANALFCPEWITGTQRRDSLKLQYSRPLRANRGVYVWRLLRALWHVALFLTLCAAWSVFPLSAALRQRVEQAGWQQLLRAFGVTIRCHGQKHDAQSIYASNHVSWIDIPVLSMLLGAPFVAKSDVATWPVIGSLAMRYGCVFVDRNRRSTVLAQTYLVQDEITRGGRLILFPEGTTGLGDCVLPFRSALFQTVDGSAGTVIQPVAICYRGENGDPLTQDRLRQIAWIDDDELLPHAFALLHSGPIHVDVYLEEPRFFDCRKAAAAYCWDAVSTRVTGS